MENRLPARPGIGLQQRRREKYRRVRPSAGTNVHAEFQPGLQPDGTERGVPPGDAVVVLRPPVQGPQRAVAELTRRTPARARPDHESRSVLRRLFQLSNDRQRSNHLQFIGERTRRRRCSLAEMGGQRSGWPVRRLRVLAAAEIDELYELRHALQCPKSARSGEIRRGERQRGPLPRMTLMLISGGR